MSRPRGLGWGSPSRPCPRGGTRTCASSSSPWWCSVQASGFEAGLDMHYEARHQILGFRALNVGRGTTNQLCMLTVGSQCPGISHTLVPTAYLSLPSSPEATQRHHSARDNTL
eukprot:3355224-Rhodomonas_salina.2